MAYRQILRVFLQLACSSFFCEILDCRSPGTSCTQSYVPPRGSPVHHYSPRPESPHQCCDQCPQPQALFQLAVVLHVVCCFHRTVSCRPRNVMPALATGVGAVVFAQTEELLNRKWGHLGDALCLGWWHCGGEWKSCLQLQRQVLIKFPCGFDRPADLRELYNGSNGGSSDFFLIFYLLLLFFYARTKLPPIQCGCARINLQRSALLN